MGYGRLREKKIRRTLKNPPTPRVHQINRQIKNPLYPCGRTTLFEREPQPKAGSPAGA